MFAKAFLTTLKRVFPVWLVAQFGVVGGLWLKKSPIIASPWFWIALVAMGLLCSLVFTPIEYHRMSSAARGK